MKIKDAKKYQEEFKKKPCDIILAFEEKHEMNSVILQNNWRFRITQEITREEFMVILNKNAASNTSVAAVADLDNSKMNMATAEDSTLPEYMKYFYKAELV